MDISPTPTRAESAASEQAEDAGYYRGILHGMIDVGADLVRLVHERAKAEAGLDAPAEAPFDASVQFDRLSRSVRRSIVLARRVAEPVRAGADRVAARKRIIRGVEDTIQRECWDDEADTLCAEFAERLDGTDVDEAIDDGRPVAEIIAEICRDLGLSAPPGMEPWARRTPGDIVELCARAARTDVPAIEAATLPRGGHLRPVVASLRERPPRPMGSDG